MAGRGKAAATPEDVDMAAPEKPKQLRKKHQAVRALVAQRQRESESLGAAAGAVSVEPSKRVDADFFNGA